MAKKPPKDPPDGYEVGYGRPPKSGKWKAGQSGNPGGKKKGTKNGATILNEVMHRKVKVTEHGKSRKIIAEEGLYLSLLNHAQKGHFKATTYLLDRQLTFQSKEAKRKASRVVVPRITDKMTLQEAADAYALSIRADKLGWEQVEEGEVDEGED